MKRITVETVLRRIEAQCREDVKAYTGYAPRYRQDGTGPIMTGAQAEARGVVDCCEDVRSLCRKLRREHRISNVPVSGGTPSAPNAGSALNGGTK